MNFARPIDFSSLMEPVAHRLLGEPNDGLSKSPRDMRFGTHGSLSINVETGEFYDHEAKIGGGVVDLVKHRLGCDRGGAISWLRRQDLLPEKSTRAEIPAAPKESEPKPRFACAYDYTDEAGELAYQVVRFEPKTFRQRRPGAEHGEWVWILEGVRRVLYRLPDLSEAIANARPVLVVEGEKDVDNLAKLGVVATCNPGGANKWRDEYSETLRGADVVLVPDNDAAGRKHMQAVAASLSGIASRVRMLDIARAWPECPEKGDVSDWIATGGTVETLWQLVEAAPDWMPERPTQPLDNFIFDGTIEVKPPKMLIQGLLPAEGLVFIGGQPTAGKTFISIHMALCLASSTAFFGRQIRERIGVVYVGAEGLNMMGARIAAAKQSLDIKDDLPFAWIKTAPLLRTEADVDRFATEINAVRSKMQLDGVRLGQVVLDTVAASFGMKDENDNAEVSGVCRLMRRLGSATGALIVPVHHYGKTAETGLRGASAWRASADLVMSVVADIDPLTGKAQNRELAMAKDRDGVMGPIAPFELKFIPLGIDHDGSEFGSCAVIPDIGGRSRYTTDPKVPRNITALCAAITEAIDIAGQTITVRSDGPTVRAATVQAVRLEFLKRYAADEDDPTKATDAKRKAFQRAINKLPSRFAMGSIDDQDFIWRA